MSIGTKLRNLIDDSGLTISEISNKTDIPNSTLSGILNDKFQNISIQKVKLICDVLDCSLDYLLDENISNKKYGLNQLELNESHKRLISIFDKLDYNYKELSLKQLQTLLDFQSNK